VPTGPFAVGTTELLWVDEDRSEAFTSDPADRRRVLVQLWYPADVAAGAARARYVRRPEEFGEAEDVRRVHHVETNAVADAPLAAEPSRLPVLFFHHGGSWTRFSSSFLTEELASHGYLVASVEHPGFDRTVLFPDGQPFVADALPFPAETGDLSADARAAWQHLEEHHFTAWRGDAVFALDRVLALDADAASPFFGRLDSERVGMLGWSFGGALSIQISADDPRVRAAADLDGQLFGDVWERGTPRPLLLLHADPPEPSVDPEATAEEQAAATAAMVELIAEVRRRDESLLERSTGERWDVLLRGATHGTFSDLVLFGEGAGALGPERGHAIVRQVVRGFFDRTLRGQPGETLLRAAALYPEVEIARAGVAGPAS
jgi:predicted dienelactone hydrolase